MSRRVVVVDDSALQCKAWKLLLEDRYGDKVEVETHTDPREVLPHLGADIHLLLLDWEMPGLSGEEVVERAIAQGVQPKRIIVTSGHPAEELHRVFDCRGCLAVIQKGEPEQQAAFRMILDSLMRR